MMDGVGVLLLCRLVVGWCFRVMFAFVCLLYSGVGCCWLCLLLLMACLIVLVVLDWVCCCYSSLCLLVLFVVVAFGIVVVFVF